MTSVESRAGLQRRVFIHQWSRRQESWHHQVKERTNRREPALTSSHVQQTGKLSSKPSVQQLYNFSSDFANIFHSQMFQRLRSAQRPPHLAIKSINASLEGYFKIRFLNNSEGSLKVPQWKRFSFSLMFMFVCLLLPALCSECGDVNQVKNRLRWISSNQITVAVFWRWRRALNFKRLIINFKHFEHQAAEQ